MLSSLLKLSRYTGLNIDTAQNRDENRSRLLSWQASVSSLVESFCNRKFIIESRTEVFDTEPGQRSYIPLGLPILSITSVKSDFEGRFDGTSDYTLSSSDYRIGPSNMSLVLNWPAIVAIGGLQVVSTGGLAYHPVRSVFACTISGSPQTGWLCVNDTKSAVGIVRAASSGSLTIENFYGVFSLGDVLAFSTTEDGLFKTDGSGLLTPSATITEITQQSLAESNPDLERAVEIEVRYMAQHQNDFENISTMDGQTTRRGETILQSAYVFQRETLAILNRYRRLAL